LELYSFVQAISGYFVPQIEQAKDTTRMEKAVKILRTVFRHVCALKAAEEFPPDGLTRELTAAEITAVFREQELARRAHPPPQPRVHP
jgi:hypothetical protein